MEETLSALTKKPWWQSDLYTNEDALPEEISQYAGPRGPGLVKAWPDGRTDLGWGLIPNKKFACVHFPQHGEPNGACKHFIQCYAKDEFNMRRVLYGYAHGRWNFAIVMRSVNLVAIDIDGKNGGLEHAKRLGILPPTLAETSKSGDGYHLLYCSLDTWDPVTGFGALSDHIGIEQGVDIRAVGCLYHHPQQRWNHREVVPLPAHLRDLMVARRQRQEASHNRVASVIQSGDPVEILMVQDELASDLAKANPSPGNRNNTLFAIGQKMKAAETPDWQELVSLRGTQLGLDISEVDRLIKNIETYN